MTTHDLAPFVTTFFTRHLPAERNASPHTIAAYRDTLKLLLRFLAAAMHRRAAALHVEDLTPDRILDFLEDLETTRRNTIRTRNARLAAIHCFFRYVLAQIDRSTQVGERDYLLVALLYDTGARIQELLNLAPCDVRFVPPPFVRLYGKGRRERLTPLLPQTARLVRRFLAAAGRREDETAPLIQNRNGQCLTRHGARYLLDKYVQRAQVSLPSLSRTRISPHTFRHTKAMHLLQSDIPLVTIKDFLGHANAKSTEVYVQSDLVMKRDALDRVGTPVRSGPKLAGSPRTSSNGSSPCRNYVKCDVVTTRGNGSPDLPRGMGLNITRDST